MLVFVPETSASELLACVAIDSYLWWSHQLFSLLLLLLTVSARYRPAFCEALAIHQRLHPFTTASERPVRAEPHIGGLGCQIFQPRLRLLCPVTLSWA